MRDYGWDRVEIRVVYEWGSDGLGMGSVSGSFRKAVGF